MPRLIGDIRQVPVARLERPSEDLRMVEHQERDDRSGSCPEGDHLRRDPTGLRGRAVSPTYTASKPALSALVYSAATASPASAPPSASISTRRGRQERTREHRRSRRAEPRLSGGS
jgi:hypothetical protein